MRSFWAIRANPSYQTRIHPALTSFADECCGTLARLLAYVGALALLAILGIHLWDQLPVVEAIEPTAKPGWSVASRSHPAFAVGQFNFPEKTETYEILRHPEGGRKEVIRWAGSDEKPVAELEIYRVSGEFSQSGPAVADIAARMGASELETAGLIDGKFGDTASPSRRRRRAGLPGWSCQGDASPTRRASIGCILNRLMLLTAGNEPKLAELFAHTELRRGGCTPAVPSGATADWVTSAENPVRRGRLWSPRRQDAGFHATFSSAAALLWRGVARLSL
jgi:hypothetical protein